MKEENKSDQDGEYNGNSAVQPYFSTTRTENVVPLSAAHFPGMAAMQEAVVTDLLESLFTVKIPVALFSAFVLGQAFSTKNVMEINLLSWA